MSSPYNYTKKSQKQVKFWGLPESAERLRGMASSLNSSGVQETLPFLHWEITCLQDPVDLLKPWASNLLASTCFIQGRDNYITTYNGLFIILQKYTK